MANNECYSFPSGATMIKKPKVLVTYPNFHRYFVAFVPFYDPLVAILLGSLVQDFAEVEIFDRRYETERSWIKKLKEFQPDVIAVRIHTSGEIYTTKRMLEIAKATKPDVVTIIGGQHPSLLPDDFNEPYCDLICIGPGEETFPEVVKAVAEGKGFEQIKGLAIRKENGFIFTEERPPKSGFFHWPKLNRKLAAKHSWRFPIGITIATHGCPHRCKFCSLWFTARGTYKLRDAAEVAEDIASMPQRGIYIADDNTFHHYQHALTIADELEKRGVKKAYCAYARTDTIVEHPEVFERWKKIGLIALVVGFEVVTDEDLNQLNKKTTLENNIKAIEFMNSLGIHCLAHFIVFPHFTQKDFRQLWDFIIKYNIALPYFVPLTPTPGTILFKEAKENRQLSIFHYGFYNLEYMVYKTKLPKWHFYYEYLKLWIKATSPLFYLRMRKILPLWLYLFQLQSVMRALFIQGYIKKCIEQILLEKNLDYEKIKTTLPPSLQENYHFRYFRDDLAPE